MCMVEFGHSAVYKCILKIWDNKIQTIKVIYLL
jgi:hypothetical protein